VSNARMNARSHEHTSCPGTALMRGLTPATSAPGLSSPLPHLHRDWARPCHICAGTGLAPATFVHSAHTA
jgi:hypothetical protein